MGSLRKQIEQENKITNERDNLIREITEQIEFCENNSIKNPIIKERVYIIKQNFENKTIENLKKISKYIQESFEVNYNEYPNKKPPYNLSSKSVTLKIFQHVSQENVLNEIIPRIKNAGTLYKQKHKYLGGENADYSYTSGTGKEKFSQKKLIRFISSIFISILLIIWWWSYDKWGYNSGRVVSGFLIKIFRLILVIVSIIITFYLGFFEVSENLEKSKDYDKRIINDNKISSLEKEINELNNILERTITTKSENLDIQKSFKQGSYPPNY